MFEVPVNEAPPDGRAPDSCAVGGLMSGDDRLTPAEEAVLQPELNRSAAGLTEAAQHPQLLLVARG